MISRSTWHRISRHCAYLVQLFEVFGRDDAVRVQIEDVKEEVPELVLLEIRDQVSSGLNGRQFRDVIAEAAVDPGSWKTRLRKRLKNVVSSK